MPWLDFLLLVLASFLCFYGSFVIIRISKTSPIKYFYFMLALSLFSLGLNFFLIIPIFINEFGLFNQIFGINLDQMQSLVILRFGHFFGILFILSFTIISYSPTIKAELKHLIILILISMSSTATFIIDAFTLTYTVNGEKFSISYGPVGQLFLFISLIILIYVLSIRYLEIQAYLKSTQQKMTPFTNTQARGRFYIVVFLIILTFVLGHYIEFIPAYTWGGFTGVGIVYLIYSFKKNPAFYFTSNARLEAIIILNSKSGKVQYYKNFQDVNMLITGVMTAFNISIKHLISSKTDIQQVYFEDKALLLNKGNYTTTIVFLSDKSVISDSIVKYLSKTFETNFQSILSKNIHGVDDLKLFSTFDQVVNLIKNYYIVNQESQTAEFD